jgi:carbonic anhydrase
MTWMATDTSRPMPPTNESRGPLSPDDVLALLVEGNRRFLSGAPLARDHKAHVTATASGQHPLAAVLSGIDSRVRVETIFDLGIGDVFSARMAGNVLDEDLLGSLEFATQLSGAKLVLVLGHTSCGAVEGAVAGAELGHLTGLLQKITPAVVDVCGTPTVASAGSDVIDAVARRNVERVLMELRLRSAILANLEATSQIRIAGAMYDVRSGAVELF